jgi:2-methylcitrate dehydratase PrpD
LREKVVPLVDPTIKPEQVDMSVTLKDSRKLGRYIQHAIGSLEVPMTDADLEAKFADLAEGILTTPQIHRLIGLCLDVEQLVNVAEIAKAAVPT